MLILDIIYRSLIFYEIIEINVLEIIIRIIIEIIFGIIKVIIIGNFDIFEEKFLNEGIVFNFIVIIWML